MAQVDSQRRGRVVSAVLAGGRGSRMGGAKALAELDGRPLVQHAIAALRAVCDEVVVVAKEDTPLPRLDVPVWRDDVEEAHPRHGIVTALRRSGGAPVLVLAVDLPRVTPQLLRSLLAAGGTAVSRAEGRLQPLCAVYTAGDLAALEAAPAGERLVATVDRLGPTVVEVPAESLLNVNTPDDLMNARQVGTPGACDG